MELTSVADFSQLCMEGEVEAVEQLGKSDSMNPKMHLPFGSPVGVLFFNILQIWVTEYINR
jgi:hypothetical protein